MMSPALQLRVAIGTYGHTAAIKRGEIAIRGATVEMVEVNPIIGAFRRMVRDIEFDVCEMAPTTYMIARSLGAPFIALPIFLMRRFHHSGLVVRDDAGIKVPKDLEGKNVGVRAYSVTTGVWTRGILADEFGLDSSKVNWVVDDEEHVTALKLPPNVTHAPAGRPLADMMTSGDLQAGFTGPAGIGRAGPPLSGWEKSASDGAKNYPDLLPDAAMLEREWYRRTAIYPLHGVIVVKEQLCAKMPWLAESIFSAFVEAKSAYLDRLHDHKAPSADDRKYLALAELVGDPLPYGLKANLPAIEAMMRYAYQQALIGRPLTLDELFVDVGS
jgi:4,5-dihydroxyphthalate decarboxylase